MKSVICFLISVLIMLTFASCSVFPFDLKDFYRGGKTSNDGEEKYPPLEKYLVAENELIEIDGAMFAYVVYDYVGQYGSYMSQQGYNPNLGLLNQTTNYTSGGTTMTWYKYFCNLAESTLAEYVSFASAQLAKLAEEKGGAITIDEALTKDDKDEIDDYMKELKDYACSSGYGEVNKFLSAVYTPGVTEASFIRFLKIEALAYAYVEDYLDSLEYTDDQLLTYCNNNENIDINELSYASQDVRHILFKVDTTLKGTALEKAFDKAKAEAEKVLEEYNKGDKTAEKFGELAKEHTDDSNGEDGGLYENVLKGQMVEEFENWIYDEARVAGDVDLVKTDYGWHIMYYVGEGKTAWKVTAEKGLKNEDYEKHLEELKEKYELEYDYEAMFISLGGKM